MIAGQTPRILVAGIGNVFLGDDGFGVEVSHRLQRTPLPPEVVVADYGIRGLRLAYELLEQRFDAVILVDAVLADEPPGTLQLLELDPADVSAGPADAQAPPLEGRRMDPGIVLRLLRTLGGDVERIRVVGCRPAFTGQRHGLSDPVRSAVAPAAELVLELIDGLRQWAAGNESSGTAGPAAPEAGPSGPAPAGSPDPS